MTLVACPGRPVVGVDGSLEATAPDSPAQSDAGDRHVGLDAFDVIDATDVPADDGAPPDVQLGPPFCSLGVPVAGATVPTGFCIRRFATVPEARVLLFAPNGDLFVASPSEAAPGGAGLGQGAIVVLSDDDQDGTADTVGTTQFRTFASGISDVHGLALGDGAIYFTTRSTVFRTPYVDGQRAETGARTDLQLPAAFATGGRWTHGLARSVGGQLYASRGQYGSCGTPGSGEISHVGPSQMDTVAAGFRNPMYMRCHFRDEVCAASELGEDLSMGFREKILLLRPNSNYGYPCCWSASLPATGVCGSVAMEDGSFPLGDTPFGLDWEHGRWSGPQSGALFVALHGSFYTSPAWQGARIVYAPTDPATHAPSGPFVDFVTGFGPGGSMLERPADVTFAPDGRMFFADDLGNAVYWVAPTTLRVQSH